jgi:hypothetical protein
MILGRCPLSIFCSRGTPPSHHEPPCDGVLLAGNAHPPTHSLTHPPTLSLTQSLAHLLTRSLTHSITHPLTRPLTDRSWWVAGVHRGHADHPCAPMYRGTSPIRKRPSPKTEAVGGRCAQRTRSRPLRSAPRRLRTPSSTPRCVHASAREREKERERERQRGQ